MFFFAALSVTLFIVLTAFEWKSYDDQALIEIAEFDYAPEEIIDIPITLHAPPPPKIAFPEIKGIHCGWVDEDLEVDLEIEEEIETTDTLKLSEGSEEALDIHISVPEEQPEFPGGATAMYQFIGESIIYPEIARKAGIEGRVFVQFYVETDSSISDVKTIKGIGSGCDEVAVSIIESMPKWKPGKLRGETVRMRMIIPVYFKLND